MAIRLGTGGSVWHGKTLNAPCTITGLNEECLRRRPWQLKVYRLLCTIVRIMHIYTKCIISFNYFSFFLIQTKKRLEIKKSLSLQTVKKYKRIQALYKFRTTALKYLETYNKNKFN